MRRPKQERASRFKTKTGGARQKRRDTKNTGHGRASRNFRSPMPAALKFLSEETDGEFIAPKPARRPAALLSNSWKEPDSIEVVLGGGGIKGFGHVGLLMALEELDVKTGIITGVSIGSLLATLYANGYSPEQVFEIFLKEVQYITPGKLLKALVLPAPFDGKLIGGGFKLKDFFADMIEKYKLKPRPNLRIIAYNVIKQQPVIFEGENYDLLTALSASCAVPFVMRPVWYGGEKNKVGTAIKSWRGKTDEGVLVDGGVHHPYPSEFCKGRAIIGKLGFATELPDEDLSIVDTLFHLGELVISRLLNRYFDEPGEHIMIEVGKPQVATLSFGISRSQCYRMASHGYRESLRVLKPAIRRGEVPLRSNQ